MRRKHYTGIAMLLFLLELVIATQLRGWGWVRGSLGDMLVTMLLYFCFRTVLPNPQRRLMQKIAGLVFVFSCIIEGLQFLNFVSWLGLAKGSVLAIAIGSTFSWYDILCYGLGCLLAYAVDEYTLARCG